MKLSSLIRTLKRIQECKGDIEIPDSALNAVYSPLYIKNHKGDPDLNRDYLRLFADKGLFDYLIGELELKPTIQVKDAFSKAYDSRHSGGAIEVYCEFIELLDLLDIDYKKDW